MVDVVGLRYVEEGLQEVLRGQQQYQRSTDATVRGMKVAVNQTNQNAKSLDRLNRDVLKAENEMRRLAQALQRGAIESGQFQGEINRIAARLRALGLDRAQSETLRFARAQATLARETEKAGNAIVQQSAQVQTAMRGQAAATMFASRAQNASGMAIQQVGYQVGDFLVQVQSGTNAMVAFGQQATQLVGVLPMFGSFMGLSGTRLIALASGLGIAIPLVTAIGAAFMRTSGAAEDATDSLERLNDILSGLKDTQDLLSMSTRDLADRYGDAATAVREYALVEAQLKAALARSALQEAIDVADATVESYTQATRVLDEFGESFDISDNLRAIERDFGLVGNKAQILRSSLELLTTSLSFEDQQFALDNLLTNFDRLNISLQDLPKPVADMILKLIEANRTAEEMEQIIAALEGSANGVSSAVSGITSNLSNAVNEALRLRDAMDAVGRASLGRQDQIAVLRAQINAARGGLNTEVAKTKTETALELARGGATLDQIATAVTTAGQEESTIQELTKTLRGLTAPSGGTSGGGGGAAAAQDDYLQNLLLEAEQKRALVGLTEEETRRQEILFELKKRELPLNDARIEQIIQTEAETRKLIEAEQQREQLMQTIEGNIKSAFMSMVDGSQSVEDAFRNMLRNILLAVYEQQVAAPAAKGISSFLSNIVSGFTGGGSSIGSVRPVARPTTLAADGGAWNNGLQFFANGGVVNSPTMFGHSGGLGVMGEAGPEAIMPLKRGSDGKLGVAANGGSLTVNVVMDPSTGALGAFVQNQAGQVVAKAAPQLAQYANKTMVDQRRRGGTMKAAFRG